MNEPRIYPNRGTIMINLKRAAAVVAAPALLVLGFAGVASASGPHARPDVTHGCHSGGGGYCGGQTLAELNLAMTVGPNAHYKTKVSVYHPNSSSGGQDFLTYNATANPIGNYKVFEWDPNGGSSYGQASGLCISQPGGAGSDLALYHCNGSRRQDWLAIGADSNGNFEWVNRATDDVMTDPGAGPSGTVLEGLLAQNQVPDQDAARNQAWVFVSGS